jgi:hypothetical protein
MKSEISIYPDQRGKYRIYFNDRYGLKVFCYHEDPQSLLTLEQKECFFLHENGHYLVDESTIKTLEKLINWPA